jgi:hypothetical protein
MPGIINPRRGINPFEYLRDVFARMPLMAAADYPSLAEGTATSQTRQQSTSHHPCQPSAKALRVTLTDKPRVVQDRTGERPARPQAPLRRSG